jgi:hypothetical protein
MLDGAPALSAPDPSLCLWLSSESGGDARDHLDMEDKGELWHSRRAALHVM